MLLAGNDARPPARHVSGIAARACAQAADYCTISLVAGSRQRAVGS